MMLWLALAAMTAVAVVIAVFPILFRRHASKDSGSEVAFYSAQLAEIDRDVERGQLPSVEASAVRAEAGRRLLAARATAQPAGPFGGSKSRQRIAAVGIAAAVPIIGLGLYAHFGQPNLTDAPLASRPDETPAPDPVDIAVAHIEAEVAASPDNERAWSALAPVYLRLGRYNDAVAANRQLLRIKGEDGALRGDLGEAEVAAAGGQVTAEARADFERALVETPGLVLARFYLGLAAEQSGDVKKAIETYEPLVEEARDHPHWQTIIQTRLASLKGGEAPQSSPAATTPSAENVPDSQKGMVQAMVTRLATRLAQGGGSADDWVRLVRSYSVLDENDKARDALGTARKVFSADAAAGIKLDSIAQELNLEQK